MLKTLASSLRLSISRSQLCGRPICSQAASMAKKRAAAGEPVQPSERPKRGRAAAASKVAGEQPAAATAAAEQQATAAAKQRQPKGQAAAAAAKQQQAAAEAGTAASASAGAAGAAGAEEGAVQGPRYFLMKSEPDVFSIDDLAARPGQTEPWDGVRSHQAKKVLQAMRVGDQAFFYHSNAKPPGIVGIVEIVKEAYPDHTQWDPHSQIVKEAYPDHTQWDPKSEYYDPKASQDKPTWVMVDCKLVRKLRRQVSLEELKSHKEGALAGMHLFKYGRLSVQAVQPEEWAFVLGLEEAAAE